MANVECRSQIDLLLMPSKIGFIPKKLILITKQVIGFTLAQMGGHTYLPPMENITPVSQQRDAIVCCESPRANGQDILRKVKWKSGRFEKSLLSRS